MPTTTTVIAATNAIAASSDIVLESGDMAKLWTGAVLGSGEFVQVFQVDSGDTVEVLATEMTAEGPRIIEIGPGGSATLINGPGTYRAKKTTTGEAVAVYSDT